MSPSIKWKKGQNVLIWSFTWEIDWINH